MNLGIAQLVFVVVSFPRDWLEGDRIIELPTELLRESSSTSTESTAAWAALTTWPFKKTMKKLKPNKVYHGPNPPTHQNTEKANQLTAIADAFKTARVAARSQSNCHLNPPTEDRDRETLLFKLCK